MLLKYIKVIFCMYILLLTINLNATILNTLNGINYEWLELTQTQGMSRLEVEDELNNVNSSFYGYNYASRSLFEALLFSYSTWDGLNGFHGNPNVISGLSQMVSDFGATQIYNGLGVEIIETTVDGYTVSHDSYKSAYGYYGSAGECHNNSCLGIALVYNDLLLAPSMATQKAWRGWDSSFTSPDEAVKSQNDPFIGSFLVKASVVPIPPAALLFASGFITLVSISIRRRKYI